MIGLAAVKSPINEDWSDPSWVKKQKLWNRFIAPASQQLRTAAALEPEHLVVDVGCGGGDFTCTLATLCAEVMGIDISSSLIHAARRHAAEVETPIEFIECDASTWKPDRLVDRVVSHFGVMFFDAPVAAFSNMRTWLKDGGTFTALSSKSFRDMPGMAAALDIFERHGLASPAPDPASPRSKMSTSPYLRDVLKQAGFEAIAVESVEVRTAIPGTVDDALEFYRWWGPTSALFRDASDATKAGLVRDLAAMIEASRDTDRFSVSGSVWMLQARAR